MSLHHIANHLASKGRNGDTTLVHMTKGEVAGLQALAKAHGTTLTKNPDTGLPEAFSLKSLVPMAAGAGLMAMGVPAPIAAGIVGGGAYLTTGSLSQGLMAGLGAYGGAGLAGTAGIGAAAGEQAAAAVPVTEGMVTSAPLPALEGTTVATTPFTPSNPAYTGLPDVSTMTPQTGYVAPQGSPINGLTETNVQAVGPVAPTYSAPISSQAVTTPGMGETFMKNAAASPWKTVGYGTAALAPELLKQPEYNQPEIKGDADMGQRYKFESGYSNDIPGRTGPASYTKISDEEAKKLYGFAEGGDVQYPTGESVIRMADGGATGYEDSTGYGDTAGYGSYGGYGGYGAGIDYSGYDTPVVSGYKAPVRMATNTSTPSMGYRFDPITKSFIGSGPSGNMIYQGGGQYGLDEAGQKAADEAAAAEAQASASQGTGGYSATYAKGGEAKSDSIYSHGIDYSGYDTPANQGIAAVAPKANANQRIADLYAADAARRAAAEAAGESNLYGGLTVQKGKMFPALLGAKMVGYDASGNPVYAGGAWDPMAYKPDANGVYGPGTVQYAMQQGTFLNPAAPAYAEGGGISGLMNYAGGGSTLGGYSDGGRMLKGPGDGMSDNIPATIGGKQPARLADGEFVVPADVVSHLGNGSTDAGAKQLYKMMDKVRTARTGRKAQGKQINPKKYMPA